MRALGIVFEYVVLEYNASYCGLMQKRSTTFKTALKRIRKEQQISLQELGLRIESDASHIFKIESGQDITLSTMLRLASALGVKVSFGDYPLTADQEMKERRRKKG